MTIKFRSTVTKQAIMSIQTQHIYTVAYKNSKMMSAT